jgi:hypothetical protein
MNFSRILRPYSDKRLGVLERLQDQRTMSWNVEGKRNEGSEGEDNLGWLHQNLHHEQVHWLPIVGEQPDALVETDNRHEPILDMTAWYGLILIENTCQAYNAGYLSEETAGAWADQKDWRGAVGCYATTASRVNTSTYEGASCS